MNEVRHDLQILAQRVFELSKDQALDLIMAMTSKLELLVDMIGGCCNSSRSLRFAAEVGVYSPSCTVSPGAALTDKVHQH